MLALEMGFGSTTVMGMWGNVTRKVRLVFDKYKNQEQSVFVKCFFQPRSWLSLERVKSLVYPQGCCRFSIQKESLQFVN